jgi:hypothetical protein
MKAALVRPIAYPILIGITVNLGADSVCERDRGELVLATAQHLKSGLSLDDLRVTKSAYDGIEIYKPKRNFDKFGANGMSIARVATTEIRCNHKELVSLWLNQSARTSWDTSCKAVYPIKSNKDDGAVNTQLSHFVEKSPSGLDPSRDYVIEVLQPYPGTKRQFHNLIVVNPFATSLLIRSATFTLPICFFS